MVDIKDIEKKMNMLKVVHNFHDCDILNLRILNNKLNIRFSLPRWLDNYNILADDNHIALIDVLYDEIEIKDLHLEGNFNFLGASVLGLSDYETYIELSLVDESKESFNFFHCHFVCKSFRWSIFKIVTEKELNDYLRCSTDENGNVLELGKF